MKQYESQHRHRLMFEENERALLSTQNLWFKNVPTKLKQKCVGPFIVTEKISESAYRLGLPDAWKIHDVFHVNMLRPWNQQVADII